MRIVSWNLFGLEPEHLDARTEAAMFRVLLGGSLEQVLQGSIPPDPPEVVLFQEVVERTWFAHLMPHLMAAGYRLFPQELPARNYFEVIGVRGLEVVRSQVSRFDRTSQARHLNRVDLKTPAGSISVFTAHLESLRSGADLRTEQTQRVFTAMASCERAVFGGDTNLRPAELTGLPDGLTDAFVASGSPQKARATWRNARYDRFWLHGVRAEAFATFGAGALPTLGVPASDHLGIAVTLADAW